MTTHLDPTRPEQPDDDVTALDRALSDTRYYVQIERPNGVRYLATLCDRLSPRRVIGFAHGSSQREALERLDETLRQSELV